MTLTEINFQNDTYEMIVKLLSRWDLSIILSFRYYFFFTNNYHYNNHATYQQIRLQYFIELAIHTRARSFSGCCSIYFNLMLNNIAKYMKIDYLFRFCYQILLTFPWLLWTNQAQILWKFEIDWNSNWA